VSDINTAVVDSLKVLDLKRPIREADMLLVPSVIQRYSRPRNSSIGLRQRRPIDAERRSTADRAVANREIT